MVALYKPDVVAYNDYYPFGMLLPHRHANTPDYRYGFQGQEMDDEIKGEGNSINYSFRMHDSRVGRWLSVDPLAEEFPGWSPYNYAMNNPLRFIDPDGMLATDPTELFNISGKKIGEDANGKDGNVSIIADKTKAKHIERNYKNGGIATEADVNSGMQTTKAVLDEALNTLQRTVDNGGNNEETSVIKPNGKITRGTAETVKVGDISRTTMPEVNGDNNTSIHSHVPLNPSINDKGNIEFSSALRPGPDDPSAFSKYNLNIIVGRLGDQTGHIDQNGKTVLDKKPATGAAFYNRGGTAPILQLNEKTLEKIIK